MAQRLRILCLHGYMQNAKVFRQRTGALRKALRHEADFVFVTAPHAATDFPTMPVDGSLTKQIHESAQTRGAQPDEEQDGQPDEEQGEQPREQTAADTQGDEALQPAAWWNTMEGDVLPQVRRSTGFLCDVLRDQGPFDGIVGFSQGAAMTALFLGLLQNQNSKWLSSSAPQLHNLLVERKAADLVWPRFVLLFCGFNPFVQAIERLVSFDGKIPIPNFHMGGRKDTVTPMYRGRQLATSYFGKPTIEFHEGGHGIPTTGPFIQMYQDFIRNAMKRSVHFSKARDNKGDKGGHHDAAAARHQLSVESD